MRGYLDGLDDPDDLDDDADVVDDVWSGRLELGLARPTGAHIDIRTTHAEQRMQCSASRPISSASTSVRPLSSSTR